MERLQARVGRSGGDFRENARCRIGRIDATTIGMAKSGLRTLNEIARCNTTRTTKTTALMGGTRLVTQPAEPPVGQWSSRGQQHLLGDSPLLILPDRHQGQRENDLQERHNGIACCARTDNPSNRREEGKGSAHRPEDALPVKRDSSGQPAEDDCPHGGDLPAGQECVHCSQILCPHETPQVEFSALEGLGDGPIVDARNVNHGIEQPLAKLVVVDSLLYVCVEHGLVGSVKDDVRDTAPHESPDERFARRIGELDFGR